MSEVRVLVAVPCQDQVHTLFVADLVALLQYTQAERPDWQLGLEFSLGTYIAMQREELARLAVAEGFTHVFWLDSDMRFPPDALERLWQPGFPFMAATCSTRREPIRVAGIRDTEVLDAMKAGAVGVKPVSSIGLACAVTSVELLAKIHEPRFHTFEAKGYMGEDVSFACKVWAAGEQVLCDLGLSRELKHLGTYAYPFPSNEAVRG